MCGLTDESQNQSTQPHRLIRIALRYVLLQIPGLLILALVLIVIRQWWELSSWLMWALIAGWFAKDLALFPLVWRSYDWDQRETAFSLVGDRGIAVERLAPSGYIRVRGELWRAELAGNSPPVENGQAVRVRDSRGLTLIVKPEEPGICNE